MEERRISERTLQQAVNKAAEQRSEVQQSSTEAHVLSHWRRRHLFVCMYQLTIADLLSADQASCLLCIHCEPLDCLQDNQAWRVCLRDLETGMAAERAEHARERLQLLHMAPRHMQATAEPEPSISPASPPAGSPAPAADEDVNPDRCTTFRSSMLQQSYSCRLAGGQMCKDRGQARA